MTGFEMNGGANKIQIPEDGHYRISFSGVVGSEDEGYATLVLLDDNANNLAVVEMDAQGKQNQFRSATKIEIPVSFIVYANLNRGSELYLRLKTNKYRESSSDPNLLSGQLQIEQLSETNLLTTTCAKTYDAKTAGVIKDLFSEENCYSPNNGELQTPIKRGSTIEITKDGIYEVSVSFIFQSVGGKRIWGNLMRKHKDSKTKDIKEKVLTSAFTGIKQKKLVAGQKSSLSDSERLSLITSPSFSTIEYLKKGDQLSIKVGRKGKQSSVKSINFVMRQLL